MKKPLAVSYEVMRKNKAKKLARGGQVAPPSAKAERRPEPEAPVSMEMESQEERPAKPRLQAIKAPRMVESSLIKPRPYSYLEPEKHEGMSEDMAPPEEEYMDDEAEMLAKGGKVKPANIDRPDKGYGAIIAKAEGGEIDDEADIDVDEMEDEKHSSIAAAIMAKRDMMADGGQVDLDSMEEPNDFDELNEAALKENYDSDMDDVSQPMDSNEHGDDIPADKHDRISAMRKRMKAMRG